LTQDWWINWKRFQPLS